MKKFLPITFMVVAGLLLYPGMLRARQQIPLRVTPNRVKMNITYNGADVVIAGDIPSDAEAFVRVIGKPEHQKLKKKERVLGLLWMNRGSVTIDNAPAVFLLYPSEALAALEQSQSGAWQHLGLGIDAMEARLEILPATEDKDAIFREFVKLKERANLYGTSRHAISYSEKGDGMKSFSCRATLPSNVPQGQFTIEAVAIKGGNILARGSARIRAKETGITARLSSLAFNHGTLYGVLAVLVAIFAGLITGMIFKGGKGAH
jgi:uncharacterized protein (TIGR02186 family)